MQVPKKNLQPKEYEGDFLSRQLPSYALEFPHFPQCPQARSYSYMLTLYASRSMFFDPRLVHSSWI